MRRLALILALIGSAAALTACGVRQTIDPVAAAATKTQAAGGMKVDMTMSVDVPGLGAPVSLEAVGVTDEDSADLTMDLSSLLQAANVPISGGKVEMRLLKENGDSVIYMNAPFLTTFLPGGKPWLKLNLQAAGSKLGVDFNALLGQANQNPTQILDLLRASGSLDTVGTETVDGASTTHYSGSIDLAQAAKLRDDPRIEAAVKQLLAQGAPPSVPVDVWVGDDGLIRRVSVDYHLTHDGQAAGAKLTLDLSDYGTAVTVVAPPADQVLDLTSLATKAAEHHSSTATA